MDNEPNNKIDKGADITSGDTESLKCNMCDFVGKNNFGLKIHYHKKHPTARFNCFTCDFTCESRSDLLEHNDTYYYSHRQVLNKDYEKEILDEFQRLAEDGFLIHRTMVKFFSLSILPSSSSLSWLYFRFLQPSKHPTHQPPNKVYFDKEQPYPISSFPWLAKIA